MGLNPLDIVRGYLASEPARLIAYVTAAALTGANVVGHALGYATLPDGVANGLTLLVTALVTEAIRRFVYSPATTDALVAEASPPPEEDTDVVAGDSPVTDTP